MLNTFYTHQFAVVEIAFAGALILSGVISAGTNHVMPNHPTAKKLLNTNRKIAATIPSVVSVREVVPARTAMLAAWPMAPKSISLRRPNFSMVKIAMREARKYSVPLQAARRRLRKSERPIRWKIVAA